MATRPILEPLIERKLFVDEDAAVLALTREYILRHIEESSAQIKQYQRKYGMPFQRFDEYVHERSVLLTSPALSVEQRKVLGKAIMREEDDWLEWKAVQEMLESWLGLQQEVVS